MIKNAHIVMFSGGVSSYAAAKLVSLLHQRTLLVFADTSIEDEDTYRFNAEVADRLALKLIVLCEGRTPWEIFHDKHFIGNTMADPCSRILKRELIRTWLEKNFDPRTTTVYLGYDVYEENRLRKSQKFWTPFKIKAPLFDHNYDKNEAFMMLKREGIEAPRLYAMGFQHNNCGGFCIKAGQGHFKILLDKLPKRYAWHEEQEQRFIRENRYTNYKGLLRKNTQGEKDYLTLKEFREMVQKDSSQCDIYDIGGCDCFIAPESVE